MSRLSYATHLHGSHGNLCRRIFTFSITDWRVSAYSLIAVSFLLILLSSRAHGDELTGLPKDDPKDFTAPPPAPPQSTGGIAFAPMPEWAHGVTMPTLPYQLTPMGKKPATAVTTTTITPAPLSPPKETPAPAPESKEVAAAPKPAPAPEAPALIAVSPFLQWIKSNPQAAAVSARQQAAANSPQTPTGPIAPPAPPSPGAPASPAPYWLPPLIDSSEIGAAAIGAAGSAAIYTTPQR